MRIRSCLVLCLLLTCAAVTVAHADDTNQQAAVKYCAKMGNLTKSMAINARAGRRVEDEIASINNYPIPEPLRIALVRAARVVYAGEGTFDPDEMSQSTYKGDKQGKRNFLS